MINAEKWAIERCSQVFASTNAILRDFEKAYGVLIPRDKVKIIPFGLQAQQTSLSTSSKEKVTILFVGRLEKRKGIQTLLEVIPDLLSACPAVEVRIVGDNSLPELDGKTYQDVFEKEFSDKSWMSRVHFLGVVADDILLHEYQSCDIFVAPSLYESFGLIYLEAMRFAKPCIASNAGGMPEVVINGETGILIEPGCASDLFHAIKRLIDDEELRKGMGKKGLERFLHNYTIKLFTDRIRMVIESEIRTKVEK